MVWCTFLDIFTQVFSMLCQILKMDEVTLQRCRRSGCCPHKTSFVHLQSCASLSFPGLWWSGMHTAQRRFFCLLFQKELVLRRIFGMRNLIFWSQAKELLKSVDVEDLQVCEWGPHVCSLKQGGGVWSLNPPVRAFVLNKMWYILLPNVWNYPPDLAQGV